MVIQVGKLLRNLIERISANEITFSIRKDDTVRIQIDSDKVVTSKSFNIKDYENALVDNVTYEIIRKVEG
jgi:hypothetical protein